MRLLVIGDVMLDRFVYGDVQRISPEAATPVLLAQRTKTMPGGAANVARGIAALGARVSLIGVVGHDSDGSTVHSELIREGVSSKLIFEELRPTTTKTRYVSLEHSSHLLRVDKETSLPLLKVTEDMLVSAINREASLLHDNSCIVLSDYDKGVLTPRVIKAALAFQGKFPVIVDPKQDLSAYRGASIITPNLKELGLPLDASDDEIRVAAYRAIKTCGFYHVVVTCGERGIQLFSHDGLIKRIPARPVRVRDVSGAGDTVVAALAVFHAEGAYVDEAARRANDAAALAVSKYGTAAVTSAELNAVRGKIVSAADWTLLRQRLAEWRAEGARIGFTNGCFDLIHPGHVKLLQEARAMCDKLIVGLNSDNSVRALKGPERPIQDQAARAEVLAAMDAVDLIVIFDNRTPTRLVEQIVPDVLVKGSDYTHSEVVGSDIAKRVVLVDILPGHSTTKLIERSS